MLKENNYKELEYTLKRLFEKHYGRRKKFFDITAVYKEFSGLSHALNPKTIKNIISIFERNNMTYKYDEKSINTEMNKNNSYKIIITLEETHINDYLHLLILSLKDQGIEFDISISTNNKKSNFGIKINDKMNAKTVSKSIRNIIPHEFLKDNIPYIPSINNIGILTEKYVDQTEYEVMMNEYLYKHLVFALNINKIEICNPDFIIKLLELNSKKEDVLKNKIILAQLNLVKDYSLKEKTYVKR